MTKRLPVPAIVRKRWRRPWATLAPYWPLLLIQRLWFARKHR